MTQQAAPICRTTLQNCPEKQKPITVKAGNVPIKIYRRSAWGYRLFTVAYYLSDANGKLKRKRESRREVYGLCSSISVSAVVACLVTSASYIVVTVIKKLMTLNDLLEEWG